MRTAPPAQVLVVDDDREMCELSQMDLESEGYKVTACMSGPEALQRMGEVDFDAVLTDLAMEGMSGLELCERIVACHPDIPVLVFTGNGRFETAVDALRVGAYDFITKPPEPETLRLAVRRAVEHRALKSEAKRLRTALGAVPGFGELEGQSAPMVALYSLLDRAAQADASILITGESGTGKELTARGLHVRSRRADRPFIALNCAALPESLLESELFGHVRGAFTGAAGDHEGLLVRSNGGTVFLDEIGDMPLALQPKLLRAIQEKTVRPLGGSKEIPFDSRIIAATHWDLAAAVANKTFRADLYFRLNVIEIELPPLRLRGNDILTLAQRFIIQFAQASGRAVTGFTAAAARKLLDYGWPGNVRELRNCIERAVALTRTAELTVEDLPPSIQAFTPREVTAVAATTSPTSAAAGGPLLPLDVVERKHVEHVLEAVGGNKREAARILGLDRKTLYRKLERWALPPGE